MTTESAVAATTAPPYADRGVAVRSARTAADRGLVALFSGAVFLGAGLLFVVQPMIARLLLPSYGGSPTVWSTSSLFFQVLLLVAYLYVHATAASLGRRQTVLHLLLLAVPLLALPVALPGDVVPADGSSPVVWLLRTLVLVIGVPFVFLATTGPLLQRWFSWTDHPRAGDPYFLFAASNLGSFGGLLAYPFLIEPTTTLDQQQFGWSVGCGAFVVLTAACAVATIRRRERVGGTRGTSLEETDAAPARVGWRRVGSWLMLAFLPSSLMLAVTAHLSTDVAAVPLLWVVPLGIYLATFVVAFSRTSRTPPRWAARASGGVAVLAAVTAVASTVLPVAFSIGIDLVLLLLVGYAAHGRLAADRPSADRLTLFYVIVSVGGALGGLLNGLVAPTVFDRVLEYPLGLVAVALLGVGVVRAPRSWVERRYHPWFAFGARVAGTGACLMLGLLCVMWASKSAHTVLAVGSVLLLALVGYRLARRPGILCCALGLVLSTAGVQSAADSLEQTRTFFGSYRVDVTDDDRHTLVHGTTVHGMQWRDARRRLPTAYYAKSGPLGDVFALDRGTFDRVGAVGLGTGTVAAYGRGGQQMTFFEIDAEIVELARDPRFFTYIEDSAADVRTVVGDGRLKVAELPDGELDLLVLDAFSSDSIPIHLLTVEAMRMYAQRLAPDGLLVVHVSNRVFDLEPVVSAVAEDLGWRGVIGNSRSTKDGATPSSWIALGPKGSAAEDLLGKPGWRELDMTDTVRWTDDYSSLLAVIR